MKGFFKNLRPKKEEPPRPGLTALPVSETKSASESKQVNETKPVGETKPVSERPVGETFVPGKKPADSAASQKIVLELGDILNRIPQHLLKEGAHDPSQRIFFRMSDLSANLAEGKATIPLSSIASRCPEIFKAEIKPEDDVEIFFPWSKLLDRVRNLRAMIDQPAGDKNPASNYKSGGVPANQAVRLRQQASRTINESTNPQADKTAQPPVGDAPASVPSADPSAHKRSKQSWFSSTTPSSLVKLPEKDPSENSLVSSPSVPPPPPPEEKPRVEMPAVIPGPQPPPAPEPSLVAPPPPENPAAPPPPKEPAAPIPALSLKVEKTPELPKVEAQPPKPPIEPQKPAAAVPPPPPEPNIVSLPSKPPATAGKSAEALARECANLYEEKSKLAAEFAATREVHQKLIEKLTNDREAQADEANKAVLQLGEARVEHEKKLKALRDELTRQVNIITEDRDRIARDKGIATTRQLQLADPALTTLLQQKDDQIAKSAEEIEKFKAKLDNLGKERESLVANLDKAGKEMARSQEEHRAKLEAAKAAHDDLSAQKALLEGEIVSRKESYRQELEAAVEARDSIWLEKDELAAKLHKTAKEHAAALEQAKARHDEVLKAAQDEHVKQLAALKDEHTRQVAEKESLLSKHGEAADQERNALIKQKDESIAKLTSEIGTHKTAIEGHKKQIDTLGAEKAEAVAAAAALTAEFATAKKQHDALKDEHAKQIAALKQDHTKLIAEKDSLLSKHGASAERERNTLIKQKDELIAKLTSEVEGHKKQIDTLTKERSASAEANKKLAAEIEGQKKQFDAITKERASVADAGKKLVADHETKIKSLQGDSEKQLAALKQEHVKLIAEKDAALAKLAATDKDRAGQLKQKEETVARLTAELEGHRKQVDSFTKERASIAEAGRKLVADHEAKIKSLQGEGEKQISSVKQEHGKLIAEKDAALAKHAAAEKDRANQLKQKEETITRLKTEAEGYKKQIDTFTKERASVAEAGRKLVADHQGKIKSLQGDSEKQLAALKQDHAKLVAEKDAALAKHAAAEQERIGQIKQKDEAIAKSAAEIEGHKKQVDSLTRERASVAEAGKKLVAGHETKVKSLQDEHAKQLAALRQDHAALIAEKDSLLSKHGEAAEQERNTLIKHKEESIAQLAAEIEGHKKQIESIAGERDAAHEAAKKLADDHEAKVKALQDESAKQLAAAKDEHAALVRQKDAALAKAAGDLDAQKKQAETTARERDGIRDLKSKGDTELTQLKDQHRRQVETLTKERDALAKEKELVSSKLADAVKSHTEKINVVSSDREKILKAKEDALGQIKTTAEAHNRELHSVTRERDRLSQENRQLQQRLDETSKSHKQLQDSQGQKHTEITRQRDEAMAKLTEERKTHQAELATLQKQKDAIVSERDKHATLHKGAAEAKRGQLAVFGKEYKQVVTQRDAALAELAQAKEQMQKTSDTLSQEKDAALARLQQTLAGHEKKIADLTTRVGDLTRCNESAQTELAAARQSHAREMAAVADAHKQQLAVTVSSHKQELASTIGSHKQELEAAVGAHKEELAATIGAHKEELVAAGDAQKEKPIATEDAPKEQLPAAKDAPKEEPAKPAEERETAVKPREEVISLPLIRPVMVAPPPILQPAKSNS